ncbi:PilZ domain-containing protein [Vibrio diazotrophicus]|uniref:PilZ domain-containing protein n=1 Tax=Vibrio diazotrophicus TaxID=685 RepID=UPI000C9DC039|nr:PilZ domain-containing protein [Vibrio diazotrophicus]PNH95502.1 pilus assembly protein PilZ [Vibrio diazotrophicus]
MSTSSSNNISELEKYLQNGMKLSVSFQFGPNDNYDFTTTLVGHKTQQYLILDLPIKALELLVMRKLSNVQTVVRGICNKDHGHIVAFKTSTYQSIRRPFNLLFLRPPKHFATKTIREHERYSISLPASISTINSEVSGIMADLSVSGCGIFVAGENELQTGSKVDIRCEMITSLPENLGCHIVKISREPKGHLIGIKFDETINMSDEMRKEVLEHAFSAGSI